MLKPEERYILHLLRISLGIDDQWSCHDQLDSNYVMKTIQRNGILATVYSSLSKEMKTTFSSRFLASLSHSVIQDYEGTRILHAFSEHGLDCVALKGWELRKLYPREQLRQMADLDFLINNYDYSLVKNVMSEQGYISDGETNWKHDNFHKDNITVEIHKRLTDDSELIQEWENDMWHRVLPTGERHIFKMTPEDFCIFHFIHLHKDFLNGSLGLSRIVDTWLLNHRIKLNITFVRDQLKCFGMLRFFDNILHLSNAVMGDEPVNENDEILLHHAFTHGIYGSDISYKAGRITLMSSGSIRSGKVRSLIAALFLPKQRMKAQFPILKKWPVLLPLCWIKRIYRFLRGDRAAWMNLLDYRSVQKEAFDETKAFFRAGGII